MQRVTKDHRVIMGKLSGDWYLYSFPEMHNGNRMIGIKGIRGTGKATMFLRYPAFEYVVIKPSRLPCPLTFWVTEVIINKLVMRISSSFNVGILYLHVDFLLRQTV